MRQRLVYLCRRVRGVLGLLVAGPSVVAAFGTAVDSARSTLSRRILGLACFSEHRGRLARAVQ